MVEQAIGNYAVAPGNGTKRLRRCTTSTGASAVVAPVLPDDVVAEILARLPVKSVLRCKSVCKGWLAMLSHPSFVHRHMDCSKKNPSVLILPMRPPHKRKSGSMVFNRYRPGDKDQQLFFEHAVPNMTGYYRPAHCDGLLAVCTRKKMPVCNPASAVCGHNEIYVCNPATRELMTLPPCRPCSLIQEGFCMPSVSLCRDNRSGAYKVFHAYYRLRDLSTRAYSVGVEVLTLGAENPYWRRLPDCPRRPTAPISIASVDGALYWLIKDDASTHSAIMCLDVSTEKFTLVPVPPSDCPTWQNTRGAILEEVRGKLFFIHVYSRSKSTWRYDIATMTTEIWFMTGSPASPAWTRYCSSYKPGLVLGHGSKIILHLWESFYSYDRRSGECKDVDLVHTDLQCFRLITGKTYPTVLVPTFMVSAYAESLVTITPKRANRTEAV